MFQLVDERPGVCSIGYDDSNEAVVITWLRNDNEAFRPMLEKQLQLIVAHDAKTVIVDTREATGTLNDENQAWLGDNFFPRLSCTGLVALVNVVPRSALAVLVNRRSFRGRDVTFTIAEVSSLDEAHALARDYCGNVPA